MDHLSSDAEHQLVTLVRDSISLASRSEGKLRRAVKLIHVNFPSWGRDKTNKLLLDAGLDAPRASRLIAVATRTPEAVYLKYEASEIGFNKAVQAAISASLRTSGNEKKARVRSTINSVKRSWKSALGALDKIPETEPTYASLLRKIRKDAEKRLSKLRLAPVSNVNYADLASEEKDIVKEIAEKYRKFVPSSRFQEPYRTEQKITRYIRILEAQNLISFRKAASIYLKATEELLGEFEGKTKESGSKHNLPWAQSFFSKVLARC